MKLPVIACLFAAVAANSGSHPVQSVIKLLQELQTKVESEGEAELATWGKFSKWCSTSQDELKEAIQSSTDSIDTLTDTVASKDQERIAIENHISFLEDQIKEHSAEDVAQKAARKKANGLFKAADKDFDTTIKAVDDAIKALDASKAGALLQFLKPENPRQEEALRALIQQPLVLEQLSGEQRDALSAAVFGPVTDADILAKEKYAKGGNTYTFKSGNVLQLLRSLNQHFKDSKDQGIKAETAATNDYEVAKDARADALKAAAKAKSDKTTELGTVKGDLNKARSDLKDEQNELKSDSATLKKTDTTCRLKGEDFEKRTELRRGEIDAMKAAVEVLAKVSGVRTKAPKNQKLPVNKNALFFLQVDGPKTKAVQLLRDEATVVHSKALTRFADQLAAKLDGDSPFDAVNGMVQQMIFRLMKEQTDEDTHKHWCDKEVATSKSSKKDKEEKSKSLGLKIKDGKADADILVKKVAALDKKVNELTAFMKDATEVRTEGKKENKLAIKDAEEAQAAIAKAEAVLTSFYKDSGMIEKEEWEFLQKPSPVALPKEPKSWGASYTGVTDPSKAKSGVIAILQATAANFAKMEADSRSQEIQDQKQFDDDMKAAKIDKAASSKESEMKVDEKKRTLDSVASMTKKMKHTDSEIGAVDQYLKDLKPACIDGDSSHEDRKKARDAEIKALRKAQGILQSAFDEPTKLLQTVHQHA